MKQLPILTLTNALVLIVLASVAANAQNWGVTKDAVITTPIAGSPFMFGVPGPQVSLSSTHTAKVKNNDTVTRTGNVTMGMRRYVDLGSGTTHDSKIMAPYNGLFAPGDALCFDGNVYPLDNVPLTTTLSGTKGYVSAMTYTVKAWTHITVNGTSYNVDATDATFVIQ